MYTFCQIALTIYHELLTTRLRRCFCLGGWFAAPDIGGNSVSCSAPTADGCSVEIDTVLVFVDSVSSVHSSGILST